MNKNLQLALHEAEKLAKMRKLLEEENENSLTCSEIGCGKKLVLDVISKKYYCPSCNVGTRDEVDDLIYRYGSDNMIAPFNVRHLKHYGKDQLKKVILLRDNRYNYLYNEWQTACKGDRKARFFLNQLKDLQKKTNLFYQKENAILKLINALGSNILKNEVKQICQKQNL